MKRFSFLSIVNVIGFIIVIAVNYLANALPLNGKTAGEISDSIPILFQPAGYAFSIWSLIYLLLGVWVLRQFFVGEEERVIYEKIGFWFFISCLLNSLWIFVFHYELFNVTLLVMLGLLVSLIIIYTKIQSAPAKKWLMRTPFSIYLGWISVATIVNVFIVFYTNGIDSFLGLDELAWTLIMLVIGGVLALWFMLKNHDIYYPLVFIWAYIAIYVNKEDIVSIRTTVLVIVAILAAAVLWKVVEMVRSKK